MFVSCMRELMQYWDLNDSQKGLQAVVGTAARGQAFCSFLLAVTRSKQRKTLICPEGVVCRDQ